MQLQIKQRTGNHRKKNRTILPMKNVIISILVTFRCVGNVKTATFIIYLIFMGAVMQSEEKVRWAVETDPVRIHENVTLKCFVDENCCTTSSRQWKGGIGNKVLSFDEGTSDVLKYDSELFENGFSLIIQNFSFSDANLPYTCTYGFDQFTSTLQLGNNYELQPTDDTKESDFRISNDSIIKSVVQFAEVFPLPVCVAAFTELNLTSFLVVNQTRQEYFFEVNIMLDYNVTDNICKDNFSISCKIGSRRQIIITENNISLGHCKDEEDESDGMDKQKEYERNTVLVLGVLIPIVVVSLVILFTLVCCVRYELLCFNKKPERASTEPPVNYQPVPGANVGDDTAAVIQPGS